MDNVKQAISSAELNERLYIDSQYQIIQLKKKESSSETSANVLRDLIRQSNHHCVAQNISLSGKNSFKSELFTEYFNIIDSIKQDGLLPVNQESNFESKTLHDLDDSTCKKQIMECLKKLKNSLSLKVSNNAPLENVSHNYLPKDSNISSNVEKSVSLKHNFLSYHTDLSNNKSKVNAYICNSFNKKRPSVNIDSGNESYVKNKKIHIQKETVKSFDQSRTNDFVSARSLYRNPLKQNNSTSNNEFTKTSKSSDSDLGASETLKHFDKKIVDIVLNEIMDFSPNIKWSDIAGLQFVKSTVQEIVIWPLLRPDIFTGLRAPPRGILLFGPPGTGKTLIGKCIATESNSTFFCISASSLASKWVGESEQMVRVLFAAARLNQPAVIFIDEIDSLLSQRTDKEQDFSRKLKTEFLVQFDGAKTDTEERVLVVGATNRPHELDEAARRRFVKRLYVPLPDKAARLQLIVKLLNTQQHNLSSDDMEQICDLTDGYSGSDVAHLCKEAAMGPIRCIKPNDIQTISLDQVRPIALHDFIDAMRQVRASVAEDDLKYFLEWNKKFGSFGITD